MSDELGLGAGAKAISEGVKTGRDAGKEIGKNIEDVQKEAVELARRKANEKIRERREAELKKSRAIYKALEEYRHRKKISDEEYKLRIDFIKQHGTKEWEKLIQIKAEIEKLEKADQEFFDAELAKVKWVQFWCFLVAAWIAYYMVWGSKK
jgi:hypothetical protein